MLDIFKHSSQSITEDAEIHFDLLKACAELQLNELPSILSPVGLGGAKEALARVREEELPRICHKQEEPRILPIGPDLDRHEALRKRTRDEQESTLYRIVAEVVNSRADEDMVKMAPFLINQGESITYRNMITKHRDN